MDLLEKAELKKQQLKNSDLTQEEDYKEGFKEESEVESQGLLSRAQKRLEEDQKQENSDLYIQYDSDQEIEIIEEEEGYGYKKLGSRRIVFDHNINEYRYELIEPELNETEKELKDELAHLFKMLADIDTFDINDEEKEKFLEETIEKIVQDNDIRLEPESEEEKTFFQKLFSKNKDDNKQKSKFSFNLFNKSKNIEEDDKEVQYEEMVAIDEDDENIDKDLEEEEFIETEDEIQINSTEDDNKLEQEEISISEEEDEASIDEIDKEKTFFQKLFSKNSESTKQKSRFSFNFFNKNKNEEEVEKPPLDEESKDTIYYHIFRDFLGYGRIDILMNDDGIEDISCDGPDPPVFIHHRKYEAIETNIYFESEKELNSFVVRLCQISGKQISIFSPIVDGKLPEGSRLQATLSRTITKGSTFTIRKFKENPLTPIDLLKYKSFSVEMAAYFWLAIENGASILFCGGTASGKTTALNALLLFVPPSHKIVSIEDTREVNIPHKNWIAGVTRKGFSTADESKSGKDIDMFDLIRAALRQRPRVIIVGEVRGREAYSLFQAMATGHTAYATVHASTIHTLIQRLENPPVSLPRALLTSLDVIVFQNAVPIGGKMVRRMTSVTEIIKLDSDTNQLIFMAPFTWVSKTDDRFESSRTSKIFNKIKQQNDWTDEQLDQELDNRMLVLRWMLKREVSSYKDFGRIIADYSKFPEQVIEKVKKEMEE